MKCSTRSGHDRRFRVSVSKQTQNVCIAFVQRRANVKDVGPTLYKCSTGGLCLLGCALYINPFHANHEFIIVF